MQTLTMRARLFASLGAITLFIVLLSAASVGAILCIRTLAVDEVGANAHSVALTGSVRASEGQSLAKSIDNVKSSASIGIWTSLVSAALALTAAALAVWAVRSATSGLGGLLQKIASGANEVAAAAGEIASSSQALAGGTSEQAASLEETSASATEVTSMTSQNAGNSRSAAALMSEVDMQVTSTNRTLSEMVASMNEISASGEKISRIIKVIDEIAFQTNILALNAAVEAARAGEAGMGFAVVADEVRNLAQRSAQAARDTAALIEESIARSGQGSAKLDEVKRAIERITGGVTRAKTLIDEVEVGSHEQARGVEQIARAISQMEQATQRTAASAKQSASASQQMSAQAVAMRTAIGQMRSLLGVEIDVPQALAKGRLPVALKSSAQALVTPKRWPVALPVTRKRKPTTDAFAPDKDFVEF